MPTPRGRRPTNAAFWDPTFEAVMHRLSARSPATFDEPAPQRHGEPDDRNDD
jgi:hypothetical protein